MKRKRKMRAMPFLLTIILSAMMIAPIIPATVMAAEAPVDLGDAAGFAVLAGSTITNTGSTVIGGEAGGNVGIYPGTSVTGFPPGIINNGILHTSDTLAIQAKTDLTAAYVDAATRTGATDLSGQDLGGLTLTPGVYSFSSAAELTGTLTLDGQGDSDDAFIFQIVSTLTTADNSTINLINDAVYCRVFWQVGSSATLGTNSEFTGHILAQESITVSTGATVQGQLLAQTGAVTLDGNTITNGFCTSTLHVIKQVINDNGRTAVASDFNVNVKNSLGIDVTGSPAAGVGSPGTTYSLVPGTYLVGEVASEGYTASYSGDSNSGGFVTLAAGEEKTVTITNYDIPFTQPSTVATLIVIKNVINDNGRTESASDFNVHVRNSFGSDVDTSPMPGSESPGTYYILPPGTYSISEDVSVWYTKSYSGDSDADGNITLAAGDVKTVMITNNDIPLTPAPTTATLRIIKLVVNDDDRTEVASDFIVNVKTSTGDNVSGSPAYGVVSPGIIYTLVPGTYVISEVNNEWYSSSFVGDSDAEGVVTLAAGDEKTVTIINNDIAGSPQTGNFFADTWTNFGALIAGGLLMLLGIYLYLRNQQNVIRDRIK